MPSAVTLGESTEDIDQSSGTDTSFEFFLLETHTLQQEPGALSFPLSSPLHVGL